MTLLAPDGQSIGLAHLTDKNDFSPVYLSDTVAVWRNQDTLPRAFIVHTAEIADDEQAMARLRAPGFRADQSVFLSDGKSMSDGANLTQDHVEITRYESEQVELSALTDRPGYLVLTDSWYPGWNAMVDGKSIPVQRADVLFRAVPIEAGIHSIVFEYRSMPFLVGTAISIICFVVLAGVSIFCFHSPGQEPAF